jgi:hypothetical protein
MSKTYRTANGKIVDLDSIRLSNENAIAVGNMKVNARGDQLGPGGAVDKGRNKAMDQYYKVHSPVAQQPHEVAQNSLKSGARVTQGRIAPKPQVAETAPVSAPQSAAPAASADKPTLRGSLADSIANPSTGPKRI